MTAISNKLRLFSQIAIAITFASATSVAVAQTYPSKPIRLIVPLAPGSTADIASRFTAQELSKALGQSVVVENKAGAGGTIAMAELARSAPDGYTIGFASQGTRVFNQGIYAKPGYESTKDFAPIALLGGVSNVMIVHPTNKAGAPADVIAVAEAKPGESTFSSGGSGTSHHLSGVLFARVTGIELVHVPYKGAPQGVLAVMTNEVTMGFFNTPTVISQIKDGKVKALGVTSLARSPLLPNVPTLDEQGIKGYEVNTWFGFVAPAGTPPEVVNRLNAELNKIFTSRHTRYAMLVKVARKDTETVINALIKHARRLPQELYKTLTWDRGKEMADHHRFTLATDVKVYFCDPHNPWQRGTNENTNGY